MGAFTSESVPALNLVLYTTHTLWRGVDVGIASPREAAKSSDSFTRRLVLAGQSVSQFYRRRQSLLSVSGEKTSSCQAVVVFAVAVSASVSLHLTVRHRHPPKKGSFIPTEFGICALLCFWFMEYREVVIVEDYF